MFDVTIDPRANKATIGWSIQEMNNLKSYQVGLDKRKAKDEIKQLDIQIENLLIIQQKNISSQMQNQMVKTFEELSLKKSQAQKKFDDLIKLDEKEDKIQESVVMISNRLNEFHRGFKKATDSMKKRLLRNILKQIVVSPEGLHIFVQLADWFETSNRQLCLIRHEGDNCPEKNHISLGFKSDFGGSNLLIYRSSIKEIGEPTSQTCNVYGTS